MPSCGDAANATDKSLARRTLQPLTSSRLLLFAGLFALLALNGLAAQIAASLLDEGNRSYAGLFGVSAIIWFALFAMVRLAFDHEGPHPAIDRLDWPVLACTVAILIVPVPAVSAAGLLALGVYCVVRSEANSTLWRIGVIGLALSGPLLIGPAILALAGPELTRIEASLAGSLTSLHVEGNVITAVDGSTNFVVARGCSALANLSQAMLLTVTMGQLFGVRRLSATMGWALAAAICVVAINSSRLLALGYWPQHFDYLHEGPGRMLFVLAALAAMCGIAVWGTIHATRPAT